MVPVGGYVAYYGWWEIRVLRGMPVEDPVIEAAAAVQQAVPNTVVARWPAAILLVALAVVVLIGLRRVRTRRPQEV
jgi:cytochrome c-type biogenesis protein